MKSNAFCKENSSFQLSQIIDFLKVISDKNRLKILCLLKEEKKCVCEISESLQLAQNLTSHHLKVLKDYNLIVSKKKGLYIFYSLNKKVVLKYLNLINKIIN